MTGLAAIVSALHLLALAIGLPAIFLRGGALRGPLDRAGLARVFAADTAWGIAAVLWILTGPARAFGPLEKGTTYYLSNRLFLAKISLFVLVLLLEIAPMVGLIRWRLALARGETPDTVAAGRYATLSRIELVVVIVMVFLASFTARGFGMRS